MIKSVGTRCPEEYETWMSSHFSLGIAENRWSFFPERYWSINMMHMYFPFKIQAKVTKISPDEKNILKFAWVRLFLSTRMEKNKQQFSRADLLHVGKTA